MIVVVRSAASTRVQIIRSQASTRVVGLRGA